MTIKCMKLDQKAITPNYKTAGSAGADLHSLVGLTLGPGDIRLLRTGIALQIPAGYEGQIRSRSGLASKGIFVLNAPGTIDSDYTGEIKVILMNASKEGYNIAEQDRIAQIVFANVENANIEMVNELDTTIRGGNGFGSTGK